MKMFSAAARLSAVVRRIVYAEFHASPLVSTFSTFPWGLVVSFFSLGFSGRFFPGIFHLGFQRCKVVSICRSRKMLKNAPTLAISEALIQRRATSLKVCSLSMYRIPRFPSPRAWASASATKIRTIPIRNKKRMNSNEFFHPFFSGLGEVSTH